MDSFERKPGSQLGLNAFEAFMRGAGVPEDGLGIPPTDGWKRSTPASVVTWNAARTFDTPPNPNDRREYV